MECSLPEEWEKYSLLVMIIYIQTRRVSSMILGTILKIAFIPNTSIL